MKIVVHGPAAGVGPDGMIHSWSPDQEVTVADGDKAAVAWAQALAATALADVLEDVAKPAAKPEPETGSRAAKGK